MKINEKYKSLLFLNKEINKTFKADICTNGSTQRSYILLEEYKSLFTASYSIITTGVIDTKQRKYVMTLGIPNAFVQIEIVLKRDKNIKKIRGKLVNIILEICPGLYLQYKLKQKIIKV